MYFSDKLQILVYSEHNRYSQNLKKKKTTFFSPRTDDMKHDE